MKIYHTMLWTLVLLCINVHANTISKTDALQKAKSLSISDYRGASALLFYFFNKKITLYAQKFAYSKNFHYLCTGI